MTQPGVARTLARVLAGAWREEPPPTSFTAEELEFIEPHLMASGAAGLAWWRIRDSALAFTRVGKRFQDAYRLHTLHAALHEERIRDVLDALLEAGVGDPPVLLKGWSMARTYPARGMRPFGDIDLWVHPADHDVAKVAIGTLPPGDEVDLDHEPELLGSTLPELFRNSEEVAIGDANRVRVLRDEDALRVAVLHFLASGGWRPSGLCDIALLTERAATERVAGGPFDWNACLTADEQVRDWVLSATRLAHDVLGANIRETPAAGIPSPPWLRHAVARAWKDPWPHDRGVLLERLPGIRHPVGIARGLRHRWPDPVSSMIALHAAPETPPLLMQGRYLAKRFAGYLKRG